MVLTAQVYMNPSFSEKILIFKNLYFVVVPPPPPPPPAACVFLKISRGVPFFVLFLGVLHRPK